MIGETNEAVEDIDELDSDDDSEDRLIEDDDDDSEVLTAEVNVEELVAKIEKQNGSDVERQKAIKRRLAEIEEQKIAMRDLESTYNFNLDDDL